ncbi:carbamoyltransferase C-terminal domain-containing protein [Ulvibacterium marinum]|uniref:carbamoyltransferase C-terminal domain-containing protein n=1 Tax=Ulvibacterium marinum TaxID=2419782 RepID=UPI003CD0D9D1
MPILETATNFELEKRTGSRMLANASFNVRGEPIICSPETVYLTFVKTGMD